MFVYTDNYTLKWPGHVFPVEKYKLVAKRICDEGIAKPEEIVPPSPVSDEDLIAIHDRGYIARVKALTRTPELGVLEFEIPLYPEVFESVLLATGGSILAGELAFKHGMAMNIGGGFHHAFAGHGEGFCIINDVAVAIKSLMKRGLVKRPAIIDCDLHQGNGTAHIFQDDDDVFTFSIHQERLYPVKEKSDLDIGLDNYTGDDEYLSKLKDAVGHVINTHSPDFILYLAGADPFEGDQLGDFKITKAGLKARDEMVLGSARDNNIPVAIVLAGGYAYNIEDVVDIHCNTARVMKKM